MNFDLRQLWPGSDRAATDALLFDDDEEHGSRWPGIIVRAVTSLILSVALWVYVTSLNNPQNSADFPNQAVDVRNVPANLRPTLDLTSVNVTVRANRSVMQNITSSSIHTYIDLSGYKEGTYELPVKVDVPPGSSVGVKPPTVQVRLDLLASKRVPLAAHISGTPDFGYTMHDANVSTTTVTVSGLATLVSRVSQAEVEVNVDRRNTTASGDLSPVALDASGNPVPDVTFNPSTVHVTVPIELSLNYRTVPVKFNVKGEPANGYRIESITVNPNIVTILGQPEVLSQTNFLDTEPVDVTGQTATVDTRTRLVLGSGVSLYNMPTNSVDVQVVIRQVQTTQILPVIVTITNARPGLDVVLTTNRLDLTLAGPLAALQAMQPTDARAVLDLTGLGPGNYEITPTVILPPGIEAISISPARLPVTILPAATPTVPLPTPQPTPPYEFTTPGPPLTTPPITPTPPSLPPTPTSGVTSKPTPHPTP
jgi:YbbR domain-containing protein